MLYHVGLALVQALGAVLSGQDALACGEDAQRVDDQCLLIGARCRHVSARPHDGPLGQHLGRGQTGLATARRHHLPVGRHQRRGTAHAHPLGSGGDTGDGDGGDDGRGPVLSGVALGRVHVSGGLALLQLQVETLKRSHVVLLNRQVSRQQHLLLGRIQLRQVGMVVQRLLDHLHRLHV
uniref:Putative secreted protein n=1 Tax=Ixodes ricinus TaxID=34613 RepID=A0A6B0UYT2_IXORI